MEEEYLEDMDAWYRDKMLHAQRAYKYLKKEAEQEGETGKVLTLNQEDLVDQWFDDIQVKWVMS